MLLRLVSRFLQKGSDWLRANSRADVFELDLTLPEHGRSGTDLDEALQETARGRRAVGDDVRSACPRVAVRVRGGGIGDADRTEARTDEHVEVIVVGRAARH